MGLTVNRQKKKVIFTLNRQKFIALLTVETLPGISNLTISADLHRLLAFSRNLLTGKTRLHVVLQNTLSRHYLQDLTTCLNLKIFQNFMCERPRQPPKHNS